jgi:hypothetical protein
MVNKLKFKDFRTANLSPGETVDVKFKAKKRANKDVEENVDEALTLQQRQKRSRSMKKYASRIKIGREKAARRTADPKVLKRRARKQARLMVAKKISKTDNYAGLSFAKKMEIEKRLDKLAPRIDRIAKKLLPKMRKLEQDRRRSGGSGASLDRNTTKND